MCVTEAESGVEGADLESADWVSLLSFSWLNPLFRTGAARQLRSEDLPALARKDETAAWADRSGILYVPLPSSFVCTQERW